MDADADSEAMLSRLLLDAQDELGLLYRLHEREGFGRV
jgi:hypothetical protein